MFISSDRRGQLIGSINATRLPLRCRLWKSIVLTASILRRSPVTISRGVSPNGREVERLEKLEAERARP